VDDLGNTGHRDTQIERQPIHTQAEFHEVGAQNFAGMDGRKKFLALAMDASFVFLLLVIVHNLNVVSVPFSPHEAETPLISVISTEDIYLADFARSASRDAGWR